MNGQLALSLLLVAASLVYLVLRLVRMFRGGSACHDDGAQHDGSQHGVTASKPRPLRKL